MKQVLRGPVLHLLTLAMATVCECNLCRYDRENPVEAAQLRVPTAEAVRRVMPTSRWQRGILTVLQAADKVLNDANIPYWICGGTLLGGLRHGGFIPHDDDADIECFEDDFDRIIDAFAASPLLVEASANQGTHEGIPVGHIRLQRHHDSIDVFLRTRELEELPQYPSQAEVFPLRRIAFNGVLLNAPGGDAERYLTRCYGKDWATTVRVFFNHMPCRPRLTMDLDEYNEAVTAAGYEPPETYSSSLHVALQHLDSLLLAELDMAHCETYPDAQRELWSTMGWGSPLPPPSDMEWGEE